jgi:hypothetical protein
MPFTDLTSRKVRPAVVIGKNGGDLSLVPVSSVPANTYFPIAVWQTSGLNVPSGVKAQLATIEANLVVKIIGRLTSADIHTLDDRLLHWLQL